MLYAKMASNRAMEVSTVREDSSALKNALENSDFKKVELLLDCGADPNLESLPSETRTQLLEWKLLPNTDGHHKCMELLLEYGANPFLFAWQSIIPNYEIMQLYLSTMGFSAPTLQLSMILLTYICLHEAAGVTEVPCEYRGTISVKSVLRRSHKNLYEKCHQDIKILKKYKIRDNLTMFDIVLKSGRELIALLTEEDCNIVYDFIADIAKETDLNIYYLNLLRCHMNQRRKVVTCKDEAMYYISTMTEVMTPLLVLDKIVSYLSFEDLLKFV